MAFSSRRKDLQSRKWYFTSLLQSITLEQTHYITAMWSSCLWLLFASWPKNLFRSQITSGKCPHYCKPFHKIHKIQEDHNLAWVSTLYLVSSHWNLRFLAIGGCAERVGWRMRLKIAGYLLQLGFLYLYLFPIFYFCSLDFRTLLNPSFSCFLPSVARNVRAHGTPAIVSPGLINYSDSDVHPFSP